MGWWAKWWRRRTCDHDWVLVDKQRILGALPTREWGGSYVDYHYIYVSRCSHCGATRARNGT